MGKEIIKPVVEAVDEAVKDDKQLTPEDLENREVGRAVRQIRGIWSPDLEQTPDVVLDRNDVLSTILQVSIATGIDHQEIADWIYGPGKVNVEKYLDQLWTDDYARYRDGHIPPQPRDWLGRKQPITSEIARKYETDPATRLPVKRLSLMATPKDQLEIVFYEFRDGRYGLNYNHFHLLEGTTDDGREWSDWRPVGGVKPTEEVKNFDEANLRVKEIIQRLREKERYMVTRLTEGGDHVSGKGGGGRGALDVNPRSVQGDGSVDEDVELDFLELEEELRTSSDKLWVMDQLEKARDTDRGLRLLDAALENQAITGDPYNLNELINYYGKNAEVVGKIYEAADDPSRLAYYLANNPENIWLFEGVIDRESFETYISRIPSEYRGVFVRRFRELKLQGRYNRPNAPTPISLAKDMESY